MTVTREEKNYARKSSLTHNARSKLEQLLGLIKKSCSRPQPLIKPQLSLPFKLNPPVQPNIESGSASHNKSKLQLKKIVLGVCFLIAIPLVISMGILVIVLNEFGMLPPHVLNVAEGLGTLIIGIATLIAALFSIAPIEKYFYNLFSEKRHRKQVLRITGSTAIFMIALMTVLLVVVVPPRPRTLVGNSTPTATPKVVLVPPHPLPTPTPTQSAGSSPGGGQEPSQSTPISTPISPPPGKSKKPTPLPTWIPVLSRFIPYCDNPTGVEVDWYVHSVGTHSSCNNPVGLTMQQISSNAYGEMDIDEIQGSSYNLPSLRASVQVSFPNPSDTLTSAALIVQTPFQTSAVRTISNGYIFMLNSKGCWKLQYLGNPKTEDTDCVIINLQSVTMTVIVQNDVLTALVNGKPVVPYSVKLHQVPWQVGLVVTSSTAPSSQVVFSNFELDKQG